MQANDAESRSIYTELAVRRKRSALLSERAAALGIASAVETVADDFADAGEDAVASEVPVEAQPDESDCSAEVAAEAATVEPSDLEVEGLAGEAEPSEAANAQNPEKRTPQQAATPEEAIASSEALLAPEPAAPEQAEQLAEAEKLADQIGPIVDIQRLPKTRPSRVLSKAAKLEAAARDNDQPPAKEAPSRPSPAPRAEAERSTDSGRKKKPATLLDSYFKGL